MFKINVVWYKARVVLDSTTTVCRINKALLHSKGFRNKFTWCIYTQAVFSRLNEQDNVIEFITHWVH